MKAKLSVLVAALFLVSAVALLAEKDRPHEGKVIRIDQDAKMLELQTRTVQRFGVERFASTEIDVIGPQALRLLLQAQRGEKPPADAPPEEHRVRMRV